MKTLYNKIVLLGAVLLILASCKKDEERITVRAGDPPALKSSVSTLVLSQDDAAENAVTFSWDAYAVTWSDDQYKSDIVKYTIEADIKGQNFASPVITDVSGTSKVFTVSAFNAMLTKLELAPGTPANIELRLKSALASNTTPVYSNVLNITATLYRDVPEYPSLYVAGSYQGWDPPTALKVSSPQSNTEYEGYINFPDASNEFKFTSARDWSHTNYGAGATEGSLSTSGDNLQIAGAGYYYLKADIGTLKWSALKVTWGVIGDAAGSWDVDKPLTYDAAARVWKATLTLSAGEMKFRANGKWDLNYGAGADEGLLKAGGGNLKITEPGSYQITLDLSNPGYYLYKLKKV